MMMATVAATEFDDPILPALPCERGFEALAAEAATIPDAEELAADPSIHFKAFATHGGLIVYGFTQPGHPAYPTFTRRHMRREGGSWYIETAFCPYGEDAAAL